MARKSGGGGRRGGRQGENRDIGRAKFGRTFAGGGKSIPLGHLGNAFVSTSSGEMTPERQTYSLRDEARNTAEHHRSSVRSDNRLRNRKITFVSAGHFDAKKLTELGAPDTKITQNTSGSTGRLEGSVTQLEDSLVGTGLHEVAPPAETDGLMSGYIERLSVLPQSPGKATASIQESCETINILSSSDEPGDSTRVDLASSVARASSPTPSDSSQELILFTGRNCDTNVAKEQTARRPTSSSTFEEPHWQHALGVVSKPGRDDRGVGLGESSSSEISEIPERRIPSRRRKSVRDKEEEAMIADYIANMKEHGDVESLITSETYRTRELGGTNMEEYESENEPSSTGSQNPASQSAASTSASALGDIDSILAKRSRSNGDQFLVQFKGYSINEVKWVPRTSLATESQLKHITAFEGTEWLEVGAYEPEDSENMDEERIGVKELRQRKISAASDGILTKLLSQRDDFDDLTSDELLGLVDTDETISDGYMFDTEGVIESLLSKARKTSGSKDHFPSATQVAEAYDDFDIMDFERPSLNRGKVRQAALPFGPSDSELENNMFSMWENDRKKKAEKKKERAELRAQGVLGKYNAADPDMKARYEAGMTADDVEREVIRFLASDREQLIFPFMDSPQRKMVHEIGNFLRLKSKSNGSKNKRFTTLYKTSISIVDPTDIQRIFTGVRARGFVWRMGGKEKKPKSANTPGVRPPRRGWAPDTTPKYRDGEIVGAAAPELGTENKGRQMLEKMGWSSGTALGALNNKGILQPVATVIKTSKAGLG